MGRLVKWLRQFRAEWRFALRVTIAAVFAYVVGERLGLAQSYWAVLTVIIVMQANLGGSLKATIERLIGTLGGTLWGLAVCLVLPPREGGDLTLSLALAVAPLAVVAALRPTLRVAPITAVIVLLSVQQGRLSPLETAIDRTTEIALGCLIALAAALTIFPARAHKELMEVAARALSIMREEILQMAEMLMGRASGAALPPLQDRLRAILVKVETVTGEAERERASHLWEGPDLRPLMRTLWRLRSDLAVMARASAAPMPEAVQAALAAPVREAAGTIAGQCRGIAKALLAAGPAPAAPPAHALSHYGEALDRLREAGDLRGLPGEAVSRLSGLAFAFEQLRVNLGDLRARADELHRWHAPLATALPAADAEEAEKS